MKRPPERKQVHAGGLRLSALEWGSPQPGKPTLVLLHGLVAQATVFRRLVDHLPEDLHVIAFDLPGAGRSAVPPGDGVSFSGMVSILQEAFRSLGISKPVLLGHSHGGALAMRLVADAPASVAGLILVAPAHPFSRTERWLVRFYLSVPGTIFARFIPSLPLSIQMLGFRYAAGVNRGFTPDRFAPYREALRGEGAVAHMLRLLGCWERDMDALRADLMREPLRVPILLLWGTADRTVPLSTSRPLLENLPNARLIPLLGVGHLPTDEAPEDCATYITGWLDSLGTEQLGSRANSSRKVQIAR